MSRVFATGLGDQNMVIEDMTIETETSREKQPKATEVLVVLSVRPIRSWAVVRGVGSGVRGMTRGAGTGTGSGGGGPGCGDHKSVSAGRGAAV